MLFLSQQSLEIDIEYFNFYVFKLPERHFKSIVWQKITKCLISIVFEISAKIKKTLTKY